jgi:predicted porin
MKKQLIAAAVAGAFALPAMAQVTISGSIQSGLMDTGAAGQKLTVAPRLGGGMNAININSSEDLGGGMSAGASFQMRFDSTGANRNTSVGPTVSANAPLFHAANVFISSGFGTVRVGKIIEDSNCMGDPWGCGGGAGMMAGSTTGALLFANSMDRAVQYQTRVINGFQFTATSTSMQAPTGSAERSTYRLNYTQGPLAVQYLMGEESNKAEQSGLTATYNLGFITPMISTAVSKTAAGVKTRDMTVFAATIPLRPGLTGLVGYSKDQSAAANADTRWALGVNYALSKRTTLGADVFEQEQVGGSSGFVLRARHTF